MPAPTPATVERFEHGAHARLRHHVSPDNLLVWMNDAARRSGVAALSKARWRVRSATAGGDWLPFLHGFDRYRYRLVLQLPESHQRRIDAVDCLRMSASILILPARRSAP